MLCTYVRICIYTPKLWPSFDEKMRIKLRVPHFWAKASDHSHPEKNLLPEIKHGKTWQGEIPYNIITGGF